MRKRTARISKGKLCAGVVSAICVLLGAFSVWGQNSGEPDSIASGNVAADVDLARYEDESSSARIEPARMGQQNGIAVVFTGTRDLHYYASPKTATAPGFELKVGAESDEFDFGEAVFPKWEIVTDPFGNKVEVYAGDFTVFLPITTFRERTDA